MTELSAKLDMKKKIKNTERKKRNADIANLWDDGRIIPVLRSSRIKVTEGAPRGEVWHCCNHLWAAPFLMWTRKYVSICVHVRPDVVKKSSRISPNG